MVSVVLASLYRLCCAGVATNFVGSGVNFNLSIALWSVSETVLLWIGPASDGLIDWLSSLSKVAQISLLNVVRLAACQLASHWVAQSRPDVVQGDLE